MFFFYFQNEEKQSQQIAILRTSFGIIYTIFLSGYAYFFSNFDIYEVKFLGSLFLPGNLRIIVECFLEETFFHNIFVVFSFSFIIIIIITVFVTSLGEIQWENPLNSIESRHISSVRRFFVKFLLSIMICLVFLICIFPFDVVPDEDVKYHGSQNKPVQRVSMFLIWVYTFGFAMGKF